MGEMNELLKNFLLGAQHERWIFLGQQQQEQPAVFNFNPNAQ